jgi:ribosome-associated protein
MPTKKIEEELTEREEKEESKSLISSRDKALLCAQQAEEYKAQEVVLLDVREFSSFSDFFIICSGKSSRQVQGIADNLERSLREHRLRPLGVEGRGDGHWILMDYGDVIIHIFYEPVRYRYDLESLWSEAKRVRLEQGAEG